MKASNQKAKLMHVYTILSEETDEINGLTVSEILDKLESINIAAERKSIYDDIRCLNDNGFLHVEKKQAGGTVKYHVVERLFEKSELMMLSDAVQAAKFIPAKKSDELIYKLMSLTSKSEARKLNCRIYTPNRAKTDNKEVLDCAEKISEAILANKTVTFKYTSNVICKSSKGFERITRHDGKLYDVSPYALIWDDENYYMVGYDNETDLKKHYRVDRIIELMITEEKRKGEETFKGFDLSRYNKSAFSMFSGEEKRVELECDNKMIEIVIDRFGKDIIIRKKTNETFTVTVNVMISPVFFSWVYIFAGKIRINSPSEVKESYLKQTTAVLESIKIES